jgi:adenylate cyclase
MEGRMLGMRSNEVDSIAAWLVNSGLAGYSETDLLHGFCERCCKAGIDLSRAITIIDTLHPIYEGRAFRWRNDGVGLWCINRVSAAGWD